MKHSILVVTPAKAGVYRPKRFWIPAFAGMTFFCAGLLFIQANAWADNESYLNYLKGMAEERAGNTAKALDAYEKAVQQDPQALQVYRDIAELRLRSGQPDAALKAAQRVKELAPNDPMSFIFLGNVFVAQGDLAKAAGAYEQALKLDPANLRALENLGNYYSLVDPEKGLTYYQRYIELSPRDADIYFQMAVVHHKRGHLQKALKAYKQSIELDPGQLVSHMALADLYEQQKSTAEAIGEYERAAELLPSNPLVLTRLGNLYYRNGQWDEAWQAYQNAEKASPHDPTIQYWLARVSEEKKNWKDAAAHAQEAWKIAQDPQFLSLSAYYLTLNHQPAEAITYLEKARESDPTSANVLLFLGMNYMDLDKPEPAREALAKGVSLYPKDAQMRFHLGMAEDRLGHFDAAVEQFRVILTIDAQNAPAMNYLGYSWAEHGTNLEEAEKLLRKAVSIDPESGAYMDSLGWLLFKRGKTDESREWLVKAVQHASDALIYEHLGDASLAGGHPEVALQAWSKALAMDPKNESLQKKLQQEGSRFLSSPDAKKYLTYLEGNLKQAKNLKGALQFKGHLNKHGLEAMGKLYYEQPDKVLVDIAATPKTGAVQYSLIGKERKVEPAQTNPAFNQWAFDGLASLSQFLSGQLTSSLKAVLSPKTGVHAQFSRPNPSGGQDEIEVVSYDFVEGIWLPTEMRLENATTGWSAELRFSDWQINQPGHTALSQ